MTSLIRRIGQLAAVLGLMGAGLLASTGTAAAAAPTTVFPLDGWYETGGPTFPRITNNGGILSFDMSMLLKRNGTGTVVDEDSISATFPDDPTMTSGILVGPNEIRWNNGARWFRTTRVPVPDVIDVTPALAASRIRAVGHVPVFAGDIPGSPECGTGRVMVQSPFARKLENPGTTVRYWVTGPC